MARNEQLRNSALAWKRKYEENKAVSTDLEGKLATLQQQVHAMNTQYEQVGHLQICTIVHHILIHDTYRAYAVILVDAVINHHLTPS